MTIHAVFCGSPVKIKFIYRDKNLGGIKADRIYEAWFASNPSFGRALPCGNTVAMFDTSVKIDDTLPNITWSKRNRLQGNVRIIASPKGVSL